MSLDYLKFLNRKLWILISCVAAALTIAEANDDFSKCKIDNAAAPNIIHDKKAGTHTCILNLRCGRNDLRAIYCNAVNETTCPGIKNCLSGSIDVLTDTSHPTGEITDGSVPSGKGPVTGQFVDPPACLDRSGRSICEGVGQFFVKERGGLTKVGKTTVVCGAQGRGRSPDLISCANDRTVDYVTNQGIQPVVDPKAKPAKDSRKRSGSKDKGNSRGRKGRGGAKGSSGY